MENASKALLMAGGVLIAILTIAVLVRSFSSISSLKQEQLTEEELAQLVAFNEQYTKYLDQYVYGTEVITVINRSFNNKSHEIHTIIEFNNGYEYTIKKWNRSKKKYENEDVIIKAGQELNITNQDDVAIDVINNPSSEDDSLMRRAFKCTNITFDEYGRVNSITFEEKQWNTLGGE